MQLIITFIGIIGSLWRLRNEKTKSKLLSLLSLICQQGTNNVVDIGDDSIDMSTLCISGKLIWYIIPEYLF